MNFRSFFSIFFVAYWLVGMHIFMHNGGGAGLYLPFNFWGWIFASLIIGLGLWKVTQRQLMAFSSLQACLWLGASLMLLPMLYPGFEFKGHAVPRLLGLFAGLLFLFSVHQHGLDRRAREQLLHVLLGGMAIEALLGLVQFYLLGPGNWVGYNTQANRPHGIFQQPNVMASFLATGLALAIWLELRSEAGAWLRVLRLGMVLAASVLLTVLQSRVGQLGAVLALLMLAPQMWARRRWLLILGLVALGIFIGLGVQIQDRPVAQRGIEIYQDAGMRRVYWAYALELIAQAPWTGWGFGGFESTFLEQYMAKFATHPGLPRLEANLDHPHNEFLYWAVEGGLAPMLGMLTMVGALLWRISRAGWLQGMGLLALLTPILLHTQTEYPFYHAVALWLALLLLVHAVDAEVEEQQSSQSRACWSETEQRLVWPFRMAAVLVPLVVLPFMLTGLHTAWVMNKFNREGVSQSSLLETIVNPLPWMARIEKSVNTLRLQDGLLNRDTEQLEAFVLWAQATVRHTPRAQTYAQLATALQILGRTDEAKNVQAQGLRLYPGHVGISKALSETHIQVR